MEKRMKEFRRGVAVKNETVQEIGNTRILKQWRANKKHFCQKRKTAFPNWPWQMVFFQKIYFYREPHGIHCQNPAHLGSVATLDVERDFCERCVKNGGSYTNYSFHWTLPELISIPSTCPIFFVVLVSRNSKRNSIANSMYADLNETILDNHRKIASILKLDTGLDYEIHVIAEIGQQGSVLSLLSDSHGHIFTDDNQLHLPAADISNLFISTPTAQPSDNNKRGVERNFTMLSGEQMLERGEEIQITQNSPESTEENIDGYITGMAIEGSSRVHRNVNYRKSKQLERHRVGEGKVIHINPVELTCSTVDPAELPVPSTAQFCCCDCFSPNAGTGGIKWKCCCCGCLGHESIAARLSFLRTGDLHGPAHSSDGSERVQT
ncbi:hypothetical protein DAPPUDRAFT_107229 [Daphnia pulex]|uniref:Uncharacterized protein n=1 Tax=Daphnia pulex TaxID=6669 RepID=E9GWE9_DAPPU|nr:hypothetical protein DAPPUDRAFT_107229 [Daphnia pulex]|eukprot:EFX76198.1 hypothetical protein DAPPUDRAFT_107229 [Daphnia pulex]